MFSAYHVKYLHYRMFDSLSLVALPHHFNVTEQEMDSSTCKCTKEKTLPE